MINADELIKRLQDFQKKFEPENQERSALLHRIGMVTQVAIKQEIMRWKATGHLWKRGALINSIQYRVEKNGVKVFSAGVPYARIHEFGTKGKGGVLPDIVPKRRKWLTIPLNTEYERVKPRSLELEFLMDDRKKAWLWDVRKKRVAYRLLKRVSIPARPYFFPGVRNSTSTRLELLRALVSLGD